MIIFSKSWVAGFVTIKYSYVHTPVNETVAQEECGQAAEQVEERTEVPQHEVQLLPLFIRGQRPPKQRPTLAANRGEHS